MKEKFVISLISNLSSNLIAIMAYYLLFRQIGATLLGLWTFLNSTVNIGFVFIDMGLNVIYYQYSSKETKSEYFGTFFTLKFLLIIISVSISLIILIILRVEQFEYILIAILLIASQSIFNIANVFFINLKARIKVFKAEIPLILTTLAKNMSIMILVFYHAFFPRPLLYLSISNLVFDIFFLSLILIFSHGEYHFTKPKKEFFVNYLKDSKPLIFFSITMIISANIGAIILDYSFGHTTLGYVSFVNSYVITILLGISSSIAIVYLSLISQLYKENGFSSIKQILYIIEKYSSIFFLTIIIMVFTIGDLAIAIFFPNYYRSVPVLYIMIFIPFLVGISQPYSYLFIATKNQKQAAYINSLVRTTIIVMMVFLIPKDLIFISTLGLGDIGYALSQTLPWIIWCLLNRYYIFKKFKIRAPKRIYLHMVLAYICYIVIFNLNKSIILDWFEGHLIMFLIFDSGVIVVAYLGLLFLFGQLKTSDIKFFFNMIRLENYKNSMLSEFSDR